MSSVYETDPVGYADQPAFLNMVVRLETALAAPALLSLGRRIEAERGRVRTFRDAPRTLDVDILLYGEERHDLPGLTIPHPRMRDRPFVLIPMVEIDPGVGDPVTGTSYGTLVGAVAPGVRRLYAGERLLSEEGR